MYIKVKYSYEVFMKKNFHSVFAIGLLATCFILPACSDSGSNSSDESAIKSSTSADAPESQANSEPTYTITLDSSGFADIQAVYQSIQPNEKAIFIVRHGERGFNTTKETPLTENGVEQALTVGRKLVGPEDFDYISTDFVRTKETCENIALGRGQTTFPYESNETYVRSTFVKDDDLFDSYQDGKKINSHVVITKWAYDGDYADAFYDLKETCESVVANTFQAVKNKITVICSHDEFIVPMLVYLTDKQADVKLHETYKWLTNLAGVAVIIDENGNRRAYAVKGLDKGTE